MTASSFSPVIAGGRPPCRPCPFGGSKPGNCPFSGQDTFILCERAEHVEQQFTRLRCGVHAFGQRSERDMSLTQRIDDGQQLRQRSAEPIQLPDNQHAARLNERQHQGQASAIILGARCAILEQVGRSDASGQQRIVLYAGPFVDRGRRIRARRRQACAENQRLNNFPMLYHSRIVFRAIFRGVYERFWRLNGACRKAAVPRQSGYA